MIAVDLGIIEYEAALGMQHTAHDLRVGSWAEDVLFILEHTPVLTMGKSGGNHDLLITEHELSKRGIPLFRLNRGGKITCHYPGQLVAYPVMRTERFHGDVHQFVSSLEEIIIKTLADFGIEGERLPEHRGVFVGSDKIASVGVEIKDRVTMHGISLNVHEDLNLYRLFVPCGIHDKGITFMEKLCPSQISICMESVKVSFLHHFASVFKVYLPNILDRVTFERRYMPFRITRIPTGAIL
jgi:lipoate-protein ligase B